MLQPKLLVVTPLPNYQLYLKYETGEEKIFDVKPYIKGDWYSELANIEYFNTVEIMFPGISWKNGQDLALHDLYELSNPYNK